MNTQAVKRCIMIITIYIIVINMELMIITIRIEIAPLVVVAG